jgi:hypothetical protein
MLLGSHRKAICAGEIMGRGVFAQHDDIDAGVHLPYGEARGYRQHLTAFHEFFNQ